MPINLQELREMYQKWLYFEDKTDRIDIVLAVAQSRKTKGIPIWLFLVGPSGDLKSEQLRALDDDFVDTYRLPECSSKSLVSGNPKVLNDIVDNFRDKLLITYDMAAMLEMHPDEKAALWAKFRDLYDGFIGKDYGTGVSKRYKDIYFCWIAGSTPVIDNQLLIHQTLGTRELIYRLPEIKNRKALMDKIEANLPKLEQMRAELKITTQAFLQTHDLIEIDIPQTVSNEIKKYAEQVRYMRAMAETDRASGELIRDVSPEEPTRILQQFLRLYQCLKSLDENYKDEDALRILKKIAESCIHPIRQRLFHDVFIKNPYQEFTISFAAKILKIGKYAACRDLNVLWNLGLINRRDTEILYQGNPTEKFIYYFSLNREHPFIQKLIPLEDDHQLTLSEEQMQQEAEPAAEIQSEIPQSPNPQYFKVINPKISQMLVVVNQQKTVFELTQNKVFNIRELGDYAPQLIDSMLKQGIVIPEGAEAMTLGAER